MARSHTNRPYNVDDCHHEVREARRGDPARLLRGSASRNDSLKITGDWYQLDQALMGSGWLRCDDAATRYQRPARRSDRTFQNLPRTPAVKPMPWLVLKNFRPFNVTFVRGGSSVILLMSRKTS